MTDFVNDEVSQAKNFKKKIIIEELFRYFNTYVPNEHLNLQTDLETI